jgi:hypothetical protein
VGAHLFFHQVFDEGRDDKNKDDPDRDLHHADSRLVFKK